MITALLDCRSAPAYFCETLCLVESPGEGRRSARRNPARPEVIFRGRRMNEPPVPGGCPLSYDFLAATKYSEAL